MSNLIVKLDFNENNKKKEHPLDHRADQQLNTTNLNDHSLKDMNIENYLFRWEQQYNNDATIPLEKYYFNCSMIYTKKKFFSQRHHSFFSVIEYNNLYDQTHVIIRSI